MAKSGNLVILLGVLTTLSLSGHVSGQVVSKCGLIPFGDSYFDVGNKKYVATEFVPSTTWPYGKSTDRPNGRYSDGKIVPDFLATFVLQPKAIPPVLQPGADLSGGASFAVGGATVLDGTANTLTFSQQVEKFGLVKSTWDDKFLSEAIFVFQIGTEDYLNFSKTNPNADASAQQAFITSVINKIKTELIRLYSLGARRFAYQTLAPLGCLPIVRQEQQLVGGACYAKLNDLAKQHNAKIRPMLTELAKAYTGFQYTVLDFYGLIERRLNAVDPVTLFNEYRFSNTNDSCCGIGTHTAFGCGYINVHSQLCEYPREYLFFDGQHNTEKANGQIAHLFYSANKDTVGPMTIRELSVYPVGMQMLEF